MLVVAPREQRKLGSRRHSSSQTEARAVLPQTRHTASSRTPKFLMLATVRLRFLAFTSCSKTALLPAIVKLPSAQPLHPGGTALGAWGRDARGRRVLRRPAEFPERGHICESKSTPRPARSRSTATPWSTISARLSTRCWRAARSWVASRRARGRRCSIHDRDSGQLLTASLLVYGIPRAVDLPAIATDFSPVASLSNPLGIKGVGDGGAVAAPPTVMNAIFNALAPLGVTDVPMPATPQRVWRAIHTSARDLQSSGISPRVTAEKNCDDAVGPILGSSCSLLRQHVTHTCPLGANERMFDGAMPRIVRRRCKGAARTSARDDYSCVTCAQREDIRP
jgi:hypothetical protein